MKTILKTIIAILLVLIIVINFNPPGSNTSKSVVIKDSIYIPKINAQEIIDLFQIVGASDTIEVIYQRERQIESSKYRLTVFGMETGVDFGKKHTDCKLKKKYVFNILAMTSKFTFTQNHDTLIIKYDEIVLKTEFIKSKYKTLSEKGQWSTDESDYIEVSASEDAIKIAKEKNIIDICEWNIIQNFKWFANQYKLKLMVNGEFISEEIQNKPRPVEPLMNQTIFISKKD